MRLTTCSLGHLSYLHLLHSYKREILLVAIFASITLLLSGCGYGCILPPIVVSISRYGEIFYLFHVVLQKDMVKNSLIQGH